MHRDSTKSNYVIPPGSKTYRFDFGLKFFIGGPVSFLIILVYNFILFGFPASSIGRKSSGVFRVSMMCHMWDFQLEVTMMRYKW